MPKHSEKDKLTESIEKETEKKPKKSKKESSQKQTSEAKKRGRASAYETKILPFLCDIEKYRRCGVTEGQLAAYYEVGKTSWAKYKNDHPEFSELLYKAEKEFKTDIINRSYQVAMGYEYTEETTVTLKDTSGNVTGTKTTVHKRYAKADAGMLQFLLINRASDEYARDPQVLKLRHKALELAEQGKAAPNMEGI